MNKKVTLYFLKDHLYFIVTYLLGTSLIILFYILLTESKDVFLYPLFLSFFILFVFLISKYFYYVDQIKKIEQSKENIEVDFQSSNYLFVQVETAIKEIHRQYLNELSHIKDEHKEKQFLFSQWIHNIKTPISVIDLLIQKQDEKTPLLHEIDEENKKVTSYLNQLLNLLRVDDFREDFMPTRVHLSNQIKDIINNRKKEFIHHNLFPSIKVEAATDQVITDAKWNKFILNQLISNAIKYSSDKVDAKQLNFRIRQDQEFIHLDIEDEGVGIESHDLKRVFKPFFTGENGRAIGNASGIGLYVVKKVCDKLNHHVRIKSKSGIGTTVTISYKTERFK